MTARLGRVSPNDPMLYKDWVIPAGVGFYILTLLLDRSRPMLMKC